MADPADRQRERELRKENERKDLEVEETHGERPLEGLSSAPTTWTQEQDDAARGAHGRDEEASRERSATQVPSGPQDGGLPEG
jgi:hypothetical protein